MRGHSYEEQLKALEHGAQGFLCISRMTEQGRWVYLYHLQYRLGINSITHNLERWKLR